MENYGVNCKTHINIFKANKKVIILAVLYNKTMENMKNVLKCIMIQVKNLKSLNKTHTKPKILNKYHAKLKKITCIHMNLDKHTNIFR